jgi:hypothetical protein
MNRPRDRAFIAEAEDLAMRRRWQRQVDYAQMPLSRRALIVICYALAFLTCLPLIAWDCVKDRMSRRY